MKLLSKEEEAGHYRATLYGGILGLAGGAAVGVLGVVGATRRYPAFNQLTLPLKAFLITSAGTFSGIVAADHSSRSYESARNPADQAYALRKEERRQSEVSGMTWTQRAMAWGREERYKIVGASWLASMVAAFALVGRNPYLSGQQKLVQARVYAQGLTLVVLIASAGFEMQDSREEKGRYKTVEYVDEKDHKKHTKQVEKEQTDGDPLWLSMVAQEEERLNERDEAIKRMEERDRKQRAKEHKEHPKKTKKEEKPKGKKGGKDDEDIKDENKDDLPENEEKHEGEEKQEEEGEEEEDEYKPIAGKKGEGKMMAKVSNPPNPGKSAVP